MPSTPMSARRRMFSHGKVPSMYCRPRGLNSPWVSSRTVATMRFCSSVSLKRNAPASSTVMDVLMAAGRRGAASCQAGLEKSDQLRGGNHARRRVGGGLLTVHKTVLGVGVILPAGRGGALEQRLLERRIRLRAGDVVVAGLDDVHRAADLGGKRDGVLLLVGEQRRLDRRVDRAAGFDPGVPGSGHQREAPAEAEADHA